MTMKFGFGQPLTRKEDDALLRGAGRYVADVAPEATLHAVVLRSPHAHARFRITDLAACARCRACASCSPPPRWPISGAADARRAGGREILVPSYPVLARDEVRHVGDAIAFVVADTPEHAQGCRRSHRG